MPAPKDSIKREEWLKKLSEASKGKKLPPFSDEHKKKISNSKRGNKYMVGKTHSKETRKKISDATKGKTKGKKRPPRSKEWCENISKSLKGKFVGEKNGNFGNRYSQESCEKISKARKTLFADPIKGKEARERISTSHKGIPSSMLGKHHSKETCKKISEAIKGKCSGENSSMFGKHHSKETCKKISEANKNPTLETRKKMSISAKHRLPFSEESCKKMGISRTGEKNPFFGKRHPQDIQQNIIEKLLGGFWYGNIRYPKYPIYCELWTEEFRNRVRAYYGYCCVECGNPQTGKKHAVHHIHYDKKTCCNEGEEIGNRMFVVLCKSCHPKTNFNRPFWEQYFTDMINNYYQGKCYFTKEEMKAFSKI